MAKSHSLTNINVDDLVGDCSICGSSVTLKKSYKSKTTGTQFYRCYRKYIATKTHIERPWVLHKKDICEKCGFVPLEDCQLTVDHIDGDKTNNELHNLMTICHNCHALKTMLNQDYFNRY
jgi:hypothetical protein